MSVVIVCCQLSINMRRTLKFILWITILLFGAGLYSMNTDFLAYEMSLPDTEQPVVPDDTVPKVRTRFPVAKTVPEEYQDLTKQSPACLLYTSDAADDTPCVDLGGHHVHCLLYTSPSPRDRQKSRMPSSA